MRILAVLAQAPTGIRENRDHRLTFGRFNSNHIEKSPELWSEYAISPSYGHPLYLSPNSGCGFPGNMRVVNVHRQEKRLLRRSFVDPIDRMIDDNGGLAFGIVPEFRAFPARDISCSYSANPLLNPNIRFRTAEPTHAAVSQPCSRRMRASGCAEGCEAFAPVWTQCAHTGSVFGLSPSKCVLQAQPPVCRRNRRSLHIRGISVRASSRRAARPTGAALSCGLSVQQHSSTSSRNRHGTARIRRQLLCTWRLSMGRRWGLQRYTIGGSRPLPDERGSHEPG